MNEQLYNKNILEYANFKIDWNKLSNKVIFLTGGTGLVGRFLTDLLMYKNINDKLNCTIVSLCLNENRAKNIFNKYIDSNNFKIIVGDVRDKIEYNGKVDYVIHAASNTFPIQYATDPVGTMTIGVIGTYNLLDFGVRKKIKKFIYISSFEVYGTVSNVKSISENDFGVVNSTILRSCYPESKRASESLCIGFSEQYGINTSIVRLSRVFGPTMNIESSLATAQFIKNSINMQDIVLKSDGMQMYSYNYVGDAVSAILTVLINGQDKEAYNVSDDKFNARLKDFAKFAADNANKKVVFDLPDEIEKKGFSNSVMTILNSDKIKNIGWYTNSDLKTRISETIEILRNKRI